VELAIGPLVELLRRELELAGIPSPGAEPTSIRTFTLWYLEVVQLLDAHCAEGDQHPAMARAEVELMCRCALSACSLEEAMQLCARYCETLYPRAGRIELRINRNMASFCLDSLRNNPTTASSLVDITGLFAFRQLFQWLVGVDLQLAWHRFAWIRCATTRPPPAAWSTSPGCLPSASYSSGWWGWTCS